MIKKYLVVGSRLVAGVAAGNEVELDDETVNVVALIQAGHVQEIPEKPSRHTKRKGDDD